MKYSFPKARFASCNTAYDQASHVCSEFHEFRHESLTSEEGIMEALDLYHSLETLFRIWEREGVDMDAVRQRVIEKNTDRAYYDAE